jgi:hypothetical protein
MKVQSPTFTWRVLLCGRKATSGFCLMISVCCPPAKYSPGSATKQSPSSMVMHADGISSESCPGCLVGATAGAVEQLARRMNNEMMHILFMLLLVRQPPVSGVGRGTFSFQNVVLVLYFITLLRFLQRQLFRRNTCSLRTTQYYTQFIKVRCDFIIVRPYYLPRYGLIVRHGLNTLDMIMASSTSVQKPDILSSYQIPTMNIE